MCETDSIKLAEMIKAVRADPLKLQSVDLEGTLLTLCGMPDDGSSWIRENSYEENHQIVESGFLGRSVVEMLKKFYVLLCEILEDTKLTQFDFKESVRESLLDLSYVLRSECHTGVGKDEVDQFSDFNLIARAIKILTSGHDRIDPEVRSCYLYVLYEYLRCDECPPPSRVCYLEAFSQYLDSLIPSSQIEGLVAAVDAEGVQKEVSQLMSRISVPELAVDFLKILFMLAEFFNGLYCNSGFSVSLLDSNGEVAADSEEEQSSVEPSLLRKVVFQVGLFFLLQHRKLLEVLHSAPLSACPDKFTIEWLFTFISHLSKMWPEDEICRAFAQELVLQSLVYKFPLNRANTSKIAPIDLFVFDDMFGRNIYHLYGYGETPEESGERHFEDEDLWDAHQSAFWKPIAHLIAEGCDRWIDFFGDNLHPLLIRTCCVLRWPDPIRDHILCESEGSKSVSPSLYQRRQLFDCIPDKAEPDTYNFFKRAPEFIRHRSPMIRARAIAVFFSSGDQAYPPDLTLLESRLLREENLYLIAKLCQLEHFSSCSELVIEKCFNRCLSLKRQCWDSLAPWRDPVEGDALPILDILSNCAVTLLSPRHSERQTALLSSTTKEDVASLLPFIGRFFLNKRIFEYLCPVDPAAGSCSTADKGYHGVLCQKISFNLQALVLHYHSQNPVFIQKTWKLNESSILAVLQIPLHHENLTKATALSVFIPLLELLSGLPDKILEDLLLSGKLGNTFDFCNLTVKNTQVCEVSEIERVLRFVELCLRIAARVASTAPEAKWFDFRAIGKFLRACYIQHIKTQAVSWSSLVSTVGWWIEVEEVLRKNESLPFCPGPTHLPGTESKSEGFYAFLPLEGVQFLVEWHIACKERIELGTHQLRGVLSFLAWIYRKGVLQSLKQLLPTIPLRPLTYLKVVGPIPSCDYQSCCELLPTVHKLINQIYYSAEPLRIFLKTVTFEHFLPAFETSLLVSIQYRPRTLPQELIYYPEHYTNRSIECSLSYFACLCKALPHAPPLRAIGSCRDELTDLHRSLHNFWGKEFRFIEFLTAAEFTAAVDFFATYFVMHKIEPGKEEIKHDPYYRSIEDCFNAGIEIIYTEKPLNNHARVIISILRMILRELNNLVDFEGSCHHNWGLFLPSEETDNGERIVQIFWTFPESPFFKNLYYPFMSDVKKECIGNLVLETLIKLQQRPPADLDTFFTYFDEEDHTVITLPQALQKVAKGLSKDFTNENARKWRKYFVEKKVAVCQGCRALCEPEMDFEADKKRVCGVCSKEGYHQMMYWCDFCEGGICEDCSPEDVESDDEESSDGFNKFDPSDSHGEVRHPHVAGRSCENEDAGEAEPPPQKRQRLE